jgi:CRISPR type I-E-associated protein CasA/Cse1
VIRLEPEGEPGNWSVRLVHVSQGSAVDEEAVRADPFFAWKVGKQGVYPFRLSADRALWRDSGALFGFSLDADPGKGGVAPQPAVLLQAQELRELLELPERWSLWLAGLDFDQAKVNLWRSEHLPLPAHLLATDEPFPPLQKAVQTGEQAGRALRDTVRFLARQLLSPDDPAGADPRQVGTLAEGWRVEELYWPALEAPFRDFLLQTERDVEAGTDEGLRAWKKSVARSAWRAFFQAARLAGDDARAYRARVAAERILGSSLRHLDLPAEGVKDE